MEKWCPTCQEEREKGTFCSECGDALEESAQLCECGAQLSPTDKFCPECGKPVSAGVKVEDSTPEEEIDPLVCPHCQTLQEDESWQFCGICGEQRSDDSYVSFPPYRPLHAMLHHELVQLATDGDPWAQMKLAHYYDPDGLFNQDEEKCRHWRDSALNLSEGFAQKGNLDALVCVGRCLYVSICTDAEHQKAADCFEQAAEKGHVRGMVGLGAALSNGKGRPQNTTKGLIWTRKAAEQGNATGQFYLGWSYFFGKGISEDKKEGMHWFRKAAEQGMPDSQIYLGLHYADSEGVSQDKKEAVNWFRKAAEQGHGFAQYKLAVCYDNGEGVTEDKKEAVNWYRKAAEQGYADAQVNLGLCYEYGEGVTEDKKEAVNWYRKAAEQGYAEAPLSKELPRPSVIWESAMNTADQKANELEPVTTMKKAYTKSEKDYVEFIKDAYKDGNISEDERCLLDRMKTISSISDERASQLESIIYKNTKEELDQDIDTTRQSNSKAKEIGEVDKVDGDIPIDDLIVIAENGDVGVQLYLGYAFFSGNEGVKNNLKRAFEYFSQAAENGNSEAEANVGKFYELGLSSVSKNYTEAIKCYNKSAKKGDSLGQFNLARCYYLGNGITQNMGLAFEWFMKAATNNSGVNAEAQYFVGYFYDNGIVVEKDHLKALMYYKLAADNDDKSGMVALAAHYFHDENHLGFSIEWLEKAMSQGDLTSVAMYSFIKAGVSTNTYSRHTGDLYIDGDNLNYNIKRVKKAKTSYAGPLADKTLVLWDDTFSGSGKKGFIITKDLYIVTHLDKIPISLLRDTEKALYKISFLKMHSKKDIIVNAINTLVKLRKEHEIF